MTSRDTSFACFKNLNISETKQDIKKLKAPLSLVRKCRSVAMKTRSTIFPLQWHFKKRFLSNFLKRIL